MQKITERDTTVKLGRASGQQIYMRKDKANALYSTPYGRPYHPGTRDVLYLFPEQDVRDKRVESLKTRNSNRMTDTAFFITTVLRLSRQEPPRPAPLVYKKGQR